MKSLLFLSSSLGCDEKQTSQNLQEIPTPAINPESPTNNDARIVLRSSTQSTPWYSAETKPYIQLVISVLFCFMSETGKFSD